MQAELVLQDPGPLVQPQIDVRPQPAVDDLAEAAEIRMRARGIAPREVADLAGGARGTHDRGAGTAPEEAQAESEVHRRARPS